jgi:hypothetical protein
MLLKPDELVGLVVAMMYMMMMMMMMSDRLGWTL